MRRLVWWVQWHRRIGAVIAVLVLLLAVTGVLINHSQEMGWHLTPVYSPWLAQRYHIPMEPLHQGFPVGPHWLVARQKAVLLNGTPVADCGGHLLGAAGWQDMLAVLCDDALLLLDAQGQMIETVRGLPAGVAALGTGDGRLWLRTASEVQAYDDASGQWQPAAAGVGLAWLLPQPLPTALADELNARNPVPGLTREQVLLDLHSGRLFGTLGIWVVDAVGVLVGVLAFSGILVWGGRYWRKWTRHKP